MYFTGDTHFYHRKIIRYCNRPFTNTHEMNRFIIDEWNKTVGDKDIIYHLGVLANVDIVEKEQRSLQMWYSLFPASHPIVKYISNSFE